MRPPDLRGNHWGPQVSSVKGWGFLPADLEAVPGKGEGESRTQPPLRGEHTSRLPVRRPAGRTDQADSSATLAEGASFLLAPPVPLPAIPGAWV